MFNRLLYGLTFFIFFVSELKKFTLQIGRNRKVFSAVMVIISLGLIWPGYALFSHHSPLVFGFPLSFAWVILCTLAGFAAMLGLFLSDHPPNKKNK